MAEQNSAPQPEQKNAVPPSAEAELRAELERERGKHKLLKGAAVVLALLFVLVAGVAFYVYKRIAEPVMYAQSPLQGLASPARANYRGEGEPQPFAAPGPQSGAMPQSTLGLFSGTLSGGGAEGAGAVPQVDPAEAAKMLKVIEKYSQRPIAKEFLNELRSDPDVAKALADAGGGANPLAIIGVAQRSASAQKIVAKYAIRPEFLKLITELMNDPEAKAFMKNSQGGMPLPQMPQTPQPSAPQASPSQVQEEAGGDIQFDPSAISGTQQPAAKPAAKAVPPPVDSN